MTRPTERPGPLGGDLLRLDVHVGAGSALALGEISPTLLLPGPRRERSRTEIDISVGAGATLAWFPELVIATPGRRRRGEHRRRRHDDGAPQVRDRVDPHRRARVVRGQPASTRIRRIRRVLISQSSPTRSYVSWYQP